MFQKGHEKIGGKTKGTKNKKTIEKEIALEVMRDKILEKWGHLINKQFELADGVHIEKIFRNTKGEEITRKIYQLPPNRQSLEYLFSMVVGRPTENVEYKGTIDLTDIFKQINKPKEESKEESNGEQDSEDMDEKTTQ